MIRKISIILCLLFAIIISGCGAEKQTAVEKEISDSIAYYDSVILKEIPQLASNKDRENIIIKLEEAIKRLDEDTDKYLKYMQDEGKTEDEKKASQYVKTAFYGVSSTVLKPMLEVFKNQEGTPPNYSEVVNDSYDMYLMPAKKLVN